MSEIPRAVTEAIVDDVLLVVRHIGEDLVHGRGRYADPYGGGRSGAVRTVLMPLLVRGPAEARQGADALLEMIDWVLDLADERMPAEAAAMEAARRLIGEGRPYGPLRDRRIS